MAQGWYVLSARLRGTDGGGRVQLTVDGTRVGEWSTTTPWLVRSAPVWIDGPSTEVGLAPVGPSSGNGALVDWLALTPGDAVYATAGNAVIDRHGRPVELRGVNRESLEATSTGWYLNDHDADMMRDWGTGIVRLQLSQHFWLSSMCTYDPAYAGRVDAEVARITSRGMVALLDLHWSTRGRSCGVHDQQEMADDLSVQFWSQVASRYRGNPLVAFDLYNEPHDIDDATWRDGGVVGAWYGIGGWHAAGMQQLYDAVRATGATNLVFVSGRNWAADLAPGLAYPLDGFGIVYAAHVYCQGCGGLPPDLDEGVLRAAATWPVVVTEFGDNASGGTFQAEAIAWAESHGLGWIAFAWAAGRPDTYALLESWDRPDPNAAGVPVRDALLEARR